MLVHCSRTDRASRGFWLMTTAFAAGIALSAPGAWAQSYTGGTPTGSTGTPTGSTTNPALPTVTPSTTSPLSDVQAANNALMAEQLVAQFYTVNSGKAFLTGALPVTPAPVTPSPAVTTPAAGTTTPPAGTTTTPGGIVQPATNTGTASETTFTATLSGGAETPAVNSPATATATFTLSKDQTSVSYQITISGLTGAVTAIRIRQGPVGQSGGIVLYNLNPPVNGVSSGSFEIRPEDISTLMSGGTYLEIATDMNPSGELRGQIVLASAGTPAVGVTTPPGTVVFPAGSNTSALQSIVNEIRAGHNAHVAMLQQLLGTNAAPAVTFQNLDAATLTQFLTMAQTLEDFAVGVDQNGVDGVLAQSATGTTGTAPAANQPLQDAVVAILADNGHYAGGMRAFQIIASTALGGNPNLTMTPNGQPFNTPLAPDQMNTFLQPFLTGTGATGTGTGTGTTATPTTGTTSGGAAGTGTNPRPTVPPTTTPSGGAAGTGTNPRPSP
jgi:hypothetical protein